MDLPTLSLAFVSLVFCTYAAVSLMLRRGLGLSTGRVVLVACGQLLWLSACAMIARSGYLVSDVGAMPPLFVRVVIGPALLAVLTLASLPATGRLLDAARADWLVSLQAFRLPLELILHGLFVAGALPRHLTYAGSNFDIATGVLALGVGYLMHKGRAPRWLVVGFNTLGLALLFTIVGMALLSAPTPMQVFTDPPMFTLPFHVPYVWLPGYLVPLALLLHLLSLRQLWRTNAKHPDAT